MLEAALVSDRLGRWIAMPDIISLGAAKTYEPNTGNYSIPQASIRRVINPNDPSDVEDFGSLPIACALGVTALPAAADETTGACAEGVLIENVGGMNGVVAAAWDVRCSEVAGQMSPGDTALHSTGGTAAKRSRVFCKEDSASIIVGNDMVLTLNRGGEEVTLAAWGNLIQITPDAVKISQGTTALAWIEIKGGAISLVGSVNVGGTAALPLVQSAGLVAALGVLAGAMNALGGSPVTGTALGGALTTLAASVTSASTTKQTTGA
jgi:hypothetical protein